MANSVKVSVQVKGMARMRAILNRLKYKARSRTDLHARWAILAMNWVNKNFQTEGGLVGGWKPLKPGTLAARRGGSGRILQDTGELRASFLPRWNAQEASVGSDLERALYHEKGTSPYVIKPKTPDGHLTFIVATQYGVKSKKLAKGQRIQIPHATGHYIRVKEVHHPGLPARRMLPRNNEPSLLRDVLKAALDYTKAQEEVGNVKD